MLLGLVCLLLILALIVVLCVGVLTLLDAVFSPIGNRNLPHGLTSEIATKEDNTDAEDWKTNRPPSLICDDDSTIIPPIVNPTIRKRCRVVPKEMGL